MPEEINGKIFKSPDEVEDKPSAEKIAKAKAAFAEFNARRDAVPPRNKFICVTGSGMRTN